MRRAALAQGLFYVATGLWPVVHLRSFEAIAGRKRDKWLVRTTGALIAAVGLALLADTRERRKSRVAKTLGIASASALGAADLYFVATGQIPRIYLADAAAEAACVGLWIADG